MNIIRTQVYLRKDQHHELRDRAHGLGIPFTELLRRALDAYLTHADKEERPPKKGLSALIGLAGAGPADGALRHDDYVAETIDQDLDREKNSPPSR